MFSIYICEDNDVQLAEIKEILEKEILIHELDMEIVLATTSSTNLLDAIAPSAYPSIYFLDIDLSGDDNGVALASKIKSFDPFGYIIFVTSYEIYMPMTFQYQLGAIDYILKDSEDKNLRIAKCLHTILNRYEKSPSDKTSVLTVSVGKSIIVIPFCEISHITTSDFPHKIIVHTLNGFHETVGTLKTVSTSLDSSFLRCHKNCIINLNHIQKIDTARHIIIMPNLFKCNYSIRCKSILMGKAKITNMP